MMESCQYSVVTVLNIRNNLIQFSFIYLVLQPVSQSSFTVHLKPILNRSTTGKALWSSMILNKPKFVKLKLYVLDRYVVLS